MRTLQDSNKIENLFSDPLYKADKEQEALQKAQRDAILETDTKNTFTKVDLENIAKNGDIPKARREQAQRILAKMGIQVETAEDKKRIPGAPPIGGLLTKPRPSDEGPNLSIKPATPIIVDGKLKRNRKSLLDATPPRDEKEEWWQKHDGPKYTGTEKERDKKVIQNEAGDYDAIDVGKEMLQKKAQTAIARVVRANQKKKAEAAAQEAAQAEKEKQDKAATEIARLTRGVQARKKLQQASKAPSDSEEEDVIEEKES